MRTYWTHRAVGISLAGALTLAMTGVGAGPASAASCSTSSPLQNAPGCDLNHAALTANLALADSDLPGANLDMAHISGQGALLGSNLAGANLNHTVITGADALVNADLAHANLNMAQISAPGVGVGADATGANLDKALIAGLGDFLSADLSGANLHRADISGTGALTGADLSRAHLDAATISGKTALFEADLTGAHLDHVTISGPGALAGANLTGADLRGANVTGTGALADAPTQQTVYSHTICPDGTNSDADGGTCAQNLALLAGASGGHPVPSHASSWSPPSGASSPAPALISHAGVGGGGGGCATPGTATQLLFLDPPPSVTSTEVAGTPFLVSVAVEDSQPCIETSDNSTSVTVTIGANPSAGVLSCTPTGTTNPSDTATVAGGIAQFNCTISAAGTGYTLSATSNTSLVGTSVPFDVAAAPPPAPPGTVVSAGGGLNLDAYCASVGFAASHVPGVGQAIINGGSNSPLGPGFAFDWYCVNGTGTSGSLIDMQAACSWQYGPATVAFAQNPDDAYSWVCIATGGPLTYQVNTSPSTYLATDPSGGTYLADGGFGGASGLPDFVYLGPDGTLVADGGLGGSSGLPDLVSSSPGSSGNGPTVTDSTPTGGFEVAESGSLATGGAI